MSINKIIGVKRGKKKGRLSGNEAVVGALPTVCMSLTMCEKGRSRSLKTGRAKI